MEINSVAIEEHGSGYLVTARFHVAKNEKPAIRDFLAGFADILKEVTSKTEEPEEEKGEVNERDQGRVRRSGGRAERVASRRPSGENDSGGEASVEPRRGRGARSERGSRDETKADAPAGRASSRRRANPEEKETSKIKDSDLAKAASEAASVVGPAVVTEVLEEFNVEKVYELAPEVRQEFLDVLKTLVAEAEEE